jgi:hypothetical protein
MVPMAPLANAGGPLSTIVANAAAAAIIRAFPGMSFLR